MLKRKISRASQAGSGNSTRSNGNSSRSSANHESFAEHWKDMFMGFAAGFIKNTADTIVGRVKVEAEKLIERLQQGIMGVSLLVMGLVFVLVGLAMFLNDLIRVSDGVGFAIVGLLALIFGYLIIKK